MNQEHPQFDAALKALDAGEFEPLGRLLKSHPDLVRARAMSDAPPYDGYFWRPTLLHHVAGNPIRGPLPENAVQAARMLLEVGAEVNAECGGGPSQPESSGGTTLGLVASGAQAHIQGFTEPLIDLLLEFGAGLDPAGNGGIMWIALFHTVEHRGQREVASALFDRGHGVDLCFAAGLGDGEGPSSGRRPAPEGPGEPRRDRLNRSWLVVRRSRNSWRSSALPTQRRMDRSNLRTSHQRRMP